MADALDSGSSGATRAGSSPVIRTKKTNRPLLTAVLDIKLQ